MAAYAASKSYILNFTEALWAEVRGRGVSLMAVCPGTTRTELFDVAGVPAGSSGAPPIPRKKWPRAPMRALEKRKQCYIPGWRNYLVTMLVRMAPRSVVVKESMKYFRPGRGTSHSDPEMVQPRPQRCSLTGCSLTEAFAERAAPNPACPSPICFSLTNLL